VVLAAYTLLQLLFLIQNQVELYHPEEYNSLLLCRDLRSGANLEPLTTYAVGYPPNGIVGGGEILHSLLYALPCYYLGPSQLLVKASAMLFKLLCAVSCVLIGRRLFGRGGAAVASLSILASPPGFTIYSSISWVNHMEGGVLVMVYLAALSFLGRGRIRRGGRLPAFVVGAMTPVLPYYSPLALLPVALVVPLLPLAMGRRLRRQGPWLLAGGLLTGYLLYRVGLPQPGEQEVMTSGTLWATASSLLASQKILTGLLTGLTEVPTFAGTWDGRWWATAGVWQVAQGSYLCLTLAGMAVLAIRVINGGAGHRILPRAMRAAAAVVVLAGLLHPWALEQTLLLQDRRLSPVFPLWALCIAGLLHLFWQARGRYRWPGRALVVFVCILGALPSLKLALSGSPPPARFRPEQIAQYLAIDLRRGQVATVNQMLDDGQLTDLNSRRQAATGFHLVLGEGRSAIFQKPYTCAPYHEFKAKRDSLRPNKRGASNVCRYVGLVAGAHCAEPLSRRMCAGWETADCRLACQQGLRAARASAATQ